MVNSPLRKGTPCRCIAPCNRISNICADSWRPEEFLSNEQPGPERYTLLGCPLSQEVDGSMVSINGLFHLLINGVYWGYNPLILTIDPNFLGHPSSPFHEWARTQKTLQDRENKTSELSKLNPLAQKRKNTTETKKTKQKAPKLQETRTNGLEMEILSTGRDLLVWIFAVILGFSQTSQGSKRHPRTSKVSQNSLDDLCFAMSGETTIGETTRDVSPRCASV